MSEHRDLLTIERVAELIELPEWDVREMIRRGELEEDGGKITSDSLLAYVSSPDPAFCGDAIEGIFE